MIQLQDLVLIGFRSIGELRMRLDEPGVCLVEGLNLDTDTAYSNGAGKSSPFSGIKWNVTGKTGSGTPTEEIPNMFLGKGCASVLTWQKNDMVYLIQRTIQFTTPQKKCPYCGFSRGKRKEQCPECGIDWSSATCLLIYSRPFDQKKFENKTPHRKDDTQKEIYRWLTIEEQGFNSIVLISQGFSDKLSSYKDAERNRFMEKFIDTEYLVIGESKAKAVTNDLRGRAATIEGQKIATKQNIDSLVSLMKQQIEKDNERKATIDASIVQLQSQVVTLQATIIEARNEHSKCGKEYTSAQEKHASATVAHEQVRLDVNTKMSAVSVLQSDTARLTAKINNIINLGIGECDKCGHPITDESKLEYKQRYEAELAKIAPMQKAAEVEQASASDLLKKHINEVGQLQNMIIEISGRINHWNNTVINSEQQLQQVTGRISELEVERSRDNMTGDLNERMLEAKQKFSDLISEEKQVLDDLAYYEYWIKGFSVQGIRSYLVDNLLNTVNKRLVHYCSRLFDNTVTVQLSPEKELKKGGSKNSVMLEVKSEAGTGYGSLSGGEARKVDVAVQLALRDAAEIMAGFQSNIFVADEILDNLDEAAAERVIEILKDFGQDRTVYLISHDPRIKSKVDKAILVKKEKGISSLVTS